MNSRPVIIVGRSSLTASLLIDLMGVAVVMRDLSAGVNAFPIVASRDYLRDIDLAPSFHLQKKNQQTERGAWKRNRKLHSLRARISMRGK